MNLDELQSVQSRERQTDSLQQLRATFYEDAAEFVQGLREERDAAAEKADDPFDSPDVNRLTDDIRTAEQTVEAIYERRVGKVVKMASLAAADMPTEQEGLTKEEQELFETMVTAIEDHREAILDVLGGNAHAGSVSAQPDDRGPGEATAATEPDDDGRVDASSVMGNDGDGAADDATTDEGSDTTADGSDPAAGGSATPGDGSATPGDGSTEAAAPTPSDTGADGEGTAESADDPVAAGAEPAAVDAADGTTTETAPGDASSGGSAASERATDGASTADPSTDDATDGADDTGVADDATDRLTVRITEDVGEIFGVDEREYDLATDDVVTLPVTNAEPLIDRDAAEPLE